MLYVETFAIALSATELIEYIYYFCSLKYKDAFICMKRHRINLNLIYDHNPKVRTLMEILDITRY